LGEGVGQSLVEATIIFVLSFISIAFLFVVPIAGLAARGSIRIIAHGIFFKKVISQSRVAQTKAVANRTRNRWIWNGQPFHLICTTINVQDECHYAPRHSEQRRRMLDLLNRLHNGLGVGPDLRKKKLNSICLSAMQSFTKRLKTAYA
jgi:hypothetical protein